MGYGAALSARLPVHARPRRGGRRASSSSSGCRRSPRACSRRASRAAGLQADDTTVTVSSDPPTDLLGLHADRVRVRRDRRDVPRPRRSARSTSMLRDVAILDRAPPAAIDGDADRRRRSPTSAAATLTLDADRASRAAATTVTATTVDPDGADVEALDRRRASRSAPGVRPDERHAARRPDRLTIERRHRGRRHARRRRRRRPRARRRRRPARGQAGHAARAAARTCRSRSPTCSCVTERATCG